jgi:hypothetical protein
VAVGRYVVTAPTTVAAGTLAALAPGEPGTGSAAGYGSAATIGGPLWATTYAAGTPLLLDSASALYTALNAAGALRAFIDGQDTAGHAALGN